MINVGDNRDIPVLVNMIGGLATLTVWCCPRCKTSTAMTIVLSGIVWLSPRCSSMDYTIGSKEHSPLRNKLIDGRDDWHNTCLPTLDMKCHFYYTHIILRLSCPIKTRGASENEPPVQINCSKW